MNFKIVFSTIVFAAMSVLGGNALAGNISEATGKARCYSEDMGMATVYNLVYTVRTSDNYQDPEPADTLFLQVVDPALPDGGVQEHVLTEINNTGSGVFLASKNNGLIVYVSAWTLPEIEMISFQPNNHNKYDPNYGYRVNCTPYF